MQRLRPFVRRSFILLLRRSFANLITANEVIRKKPTYNLFNNNCQDFAIAVLDQICNVKQTASQSDREAFARILSAFLVGTILV